MKSLPRKLALPLTLGLSLSFTLLGLMTYLSLELSVAHASGAHHVALDCTGLPSPCYTSVQAAVDAAAPGDVIKVAAGTYTGVSAHAGVSQMVYISKSVTIRGGYAPAFTEPPDPQANPTILDAQGGGRVFYLTGTITTTLAGLQLTGGKAAGDRGGGLANNVSLTIVDHCLIISNTAYMGGGLNNSGTMIMRHTVVNSNTASSSGGGGISNYGGVLTVEQSDIVSNTAYNGGGILSVNGPITLNYTTVRNNRSSGQGAGIDNNGGSTMTMNYSTVSGNIGGGLGGGIINLNVMTVNNSTINSNNGGGGFHHGGSLSTLNNTTISSNTGNWGGGMSLWGGTVRLHNSTIDNNSANMGGGIHVLGSFSTTIYFRNTIIAGNSAPTGPDCHTDASKFLTSQGYNLIQNTSSCAINGDTTGNIVGQNPLLGPLQDNGGHIFTRALLPGSPAIDAVAPGNCMDYLGNVIGTDQRGIDRPLDGNGDSVARCDIGAFEAGASILIEKTANAEVANVGLAVIYTYRVQNISSNVLSGISASDDKLGLINLPLTTLAPGEFTSAVLTGVVTQADLPNPLINTATVVGILQPAGTVVSDTARVAVALNFSPFVSDLEIRKTVLPLGLTVPGQPLTYTIAFTNRGPYTAINVLLTDTVPVPTLTNLSFVHSGVPITQIGGSPATWQVADLAPGEGGVITLTASIRANLTSNTSFYNTATITGTVIDTNSTNNNSTAATTAILFNQSPVLTITGLTLTQGSTSTISYTLLQAEDADNPPAQLTYTLKITPTNGYLTLNGVSLGIGASFTQADINSGRLVYHHNGSATVSDSFAFMLADKPDKPTTRVSVSAAGMEGNGASTIGSISAEGRYVAFSSAATNLVSGDTNAYVDVFVHDRQTGQVSRVSVASDGSQANNHCSYPAISADGRFVAIYSSASNLVSGDTNGTFDIFVHDRQTGQTTRVSVAMGGMQTNNSSDSPAISADGRYVAFRSLASNLVSGDTNNQNDIFVHDRQTGQTTRVSVSSGGAQGNSFSQSPSISADGRYIVFESNASTLVSGDLNNKSDTFIHDRETGQTNFISLAFDGSQANNSSYYPSISADGRYVAFGSDASNLVSNDTNNKRDIFVYDRQTGQTRRVSVNSAGQEGNDNSFAPPHSISPEGRYITFSSWAGNLTDGDTNNERDIFVHDLQTSRTSRASVTAEGAQANGWSFESAISAHGRIVTFQSEASDLVNNDTNAVRDIFVRDTGIISASLPISIALPGVTITETEGSTAVTEGSAETDSYAVVLNSRPQAPVTITLTADTQTMVAPPLLIFDQMSWHLPQTTTVTAVNDGIVEGPHLGMISHTISSSDTNYAGLTITNVVVSITDNSTDLRVTKTVTPALGVPGQAITYTLAFTNNGAITVTGVTITDVIPITLASSRFDSFGALITPTGSLSYVWQVADLLAGQDGLITITGIVSPDLITDTAFSNAVIITSAAAEIDPTNNTDTASVAVIMPGTPLLTISKDGPPAANAGVPITYTLTVTNSGNLTATNLIITDAIPAGASYVSGGTKVGNVVSWTVPSLAAGGGVTRTTFVVTATKTITNSDYGVRADGGYNIQGSSTVVTVVSTSASSPQVFLPLIMKN